MIKILIQQLPKFLGNSNSFNLKETENGLIFTINNKEYFVKSDIESVNNFIGYDISQKANIYSKMLNKKYSIRKPNVDDSLLFDNVKINNPDVFLIDRNIKNEFVLIDGCHIEADGFGYWLRGVERWLRHNRFNIKTTYDSESKWDGQKLPFWSIKIGPPFEEPLPGKWKTLFTCVDETGEKGAGKYLGHYDEIWVPMPCQIEKIHQMGYVGSVTVVRPPIKWNVREPENPTELVWVGSTVERKQRELQRQWNEQKQLNIVEINRWDHMLSNDEYKEKTINSKGLVVTSRSEGYGMPIREFAYSGLPVYGVPTPEYDGLIFEAQTAQELVDKISQPNKSYELSVQLQHKVRHFGATEIAGWFPAPPRCGVQSHHQGLCEALGIPAVASKGSNDKLLVSFHEFYAERIFNEIPSYNIIAFDIHSISNKSKKRLIEIFGNSVKYIGHREDHIKDLPNGVVLPLYTRAKRLNLKKQNIVYHGGLMSHSKNYYNFFKASELDKNSNWLWVIDLSIPNFYNEDEQELFINHLNELQKESISKKVNIKFNLYNYLSDYNRYKIIEQSKVCVVLYQEDIKTKDASALVNDALYLRTNCVCNSNWISEWDNFTCPWNENSPEALYESVLKTRNKTIPVWLENNPEKVLSQYMEILNDI